MHLEGRKILIKNSQQPSFFNPRNKIVKNCFAYTCQCSRGVARPIISASRGIPFLVRKVFHSQRKGPKKAEDPGSNACLACKPHLQASMPENPGGSTFLLPIFLCQACPIFWSIDFSPYGIFKRAQYSPSHGDTKNLRILLELRTENLYKAVFIIKQAIPFSFLGFQSLAFISLF